MKHRQANDTQYHYNAHCLNSVCYDDALTTIYHYDQYGRVDSLYDESGVVCYEYGNMGEVTRETRIYALPFLTNALALSTQFEYDSWGRILNITYPDNEVVNYTYDCGGQLFRFCNNSSYSYLDSVKYDRFGAKTSQKYGNGLKTNYTYDSYTRRLTGITTMNGVNTVSSFAYTYDPVGNVTQVTSTNPWLPSLSFSETFTYDASDQLTAATESQSQSYSLSVTYGDWGKINGYNLTQTDLQSNVTQSEAQSYTYPTTNGIGGSQSLFAPELRTITDINNNVTTENLTFGINGSLRKREVFGVATYTEHYLFNSQANLKAYSNNLTDFAYYGYNASNTRTYKLGFLGGSQWVNGQPEPLSLQFQQAMFYPNAYINFNHNGEYTKHYYNGAERIASRLGNTRRTIVTGANSRLQARAAQMDELFKGQIIEMLPYEEPASAIPDPNNGGGMSDPLYPTVEYYPIPTFTELQITGNTTDIFYYHTNHLGSTAYITDNNATITQGFLYAPFGEITTEYNVNFGSSVIPKYSFNAKELDEETGMYYYEARYYKPPVFTSRDPMFEKYFFMSPYAYCANNPVKYVDPDGEEIGEFIANGKIIGNDGKDDGKLYVVNNISLSHEEYNNTINFIIQNSGNAEAFTNNDIAYRNSTEIDPSEENRQKMVEIVSQDNGRGGAKPANNREYGGKYNETGKIIPLPPGEVGDLSKHNHLNYDPTNIFHSHASGTWTSPIDISQNSQSFGGTYLKKWWKQEPSEADINNCGDRTRYVFGMGNNTVYIYTKNGVQATIPMKRFVNPKRKRK